MAGGIGGPPSPGFEGASTPSQRMAAEDPVTLGSGSGSSAPINLRIVHPAGRAIRELPAAERPRERLQLRGAAGLTAAELIALLWGSGTPGRSAIDVATDAI